MKGYMSAREAAEKWGISVRQVQNHCKNGRIIGVQRVGTTYVIPEDAVKPRYAYVYDTVDTNDEKMIKIFSC